MRDRAKKLLCFFFGLLVSCVAASPDEPVSRHVILISLDGLRADALQAADAPRIKQVLKIGSYCWQAHSVYPSETLPAHASMFTGLSPAKHHVKSNHWYLRQSTISVPTIFSMAHDAGLSTAMCVGKKKFTHLARPGSVDHFEYPGPTRRGSDVIAWFNFKTYSRLWPWHDAADSITVAHAAARYLASRRPNLFFVHLADPDLVGHSIGWMSEGQLFSIHRSDFALGILMDEVKRWPEMADVIFIVTADHGGHERTHGSSRWEDMTIPWCCWGNRIAAGHPIAQPVVVYDTAPTILQIFGLTQPQGLDGRPVQEIFSPATPAQREGTPPPLSQEPVTP